jgi:hypothetical protein
MTEAKKRLHSELDVPDKKKDPWKEWVYVKKEAMHRLQVGTIIVQHTRSGGYYFYVVDSFTKGGAPRCSELKKEHIVTASAMMESHTVDRLIRERIEGTKPVVFRLTKDGLCSFGTSYSFYDEEIEYTKSSYWD